MELEFIPSERIAVIDMVDALQVVLDNPQPGMGALHVVHRQLTEALRADPAPAAVLLQMDRDFFALPAHLDDTDAWVQAAEAVLVAGPLPATGDGVPPDVPGVVRRGEELVGVWLATAEPPPPAYAEPPPFAAAEPPPPEPPPFAAAEPPPLEPPSRAFELSIGEEPVTGDDLRRDDAEEARREAVDKARREAQEKVRREAMEMRHSQAAAWSVRLSGRAASDPPEEALPEAQADVLSRTPHLDAPASPQPVGATFRAAVWMDTGDARPGEESLGIEVRVPRTVDRVELSVWLASSDHFAVQGERVQPLALTRGERVSDAAAFDVTVTRAPNAHEDAVLTAVFAHGGRPCGRVSRAVPIEGAPPAEERPRALGPPGPPVVDVDVDAEVADLTVTVTGDPARARHFECTVQAPALPAYRTPVPGEWDLPEDVAGLVGGMLDEFLRDEDRDPFDRVAALKGAGRQLFASSPPVFQAAYWALVEADAAPRSIFVVSEEPHYPWELMVPHRRRADGSTERHDPLGITCAMGRWVRRDHRPASQRLALSTAHVIAPAYDDPLPSAEAEAQFVCDRFAGRRLQPATLRQLDSDLRDDPRPLVHFIGHGATVGERGDIDVPRAQQLGQVLQLDGGVELSLTQLDGLEGVEDGLARGRPMIFVNACEVGRATPALTGIGGFAGSFTEKGALCVLAPIWQVRDDVAYAAAQAFYSRILDDPGVPLAEVVRELRSKAYGDAAEGGYAAYCFFGDPFTRCG